MNWRGRPLKTHQIIVDLIAMAVQLVVDDDRLLALGQPSARIGDLGGDQRWPAGTDLHQHGAHANNFRQATDVEP